MSDFDRFCCGEYEPALIRNSHSIDLHLKDSVMQLDQREGKAIAHRNILGNASTVRWVKA